MNYLRKSDLYRLCAHDGEDEAMSQLFDVLDELHRNGQWDAVDGFLNDFDPSRVTPVVTVLTLTLTFHAKDHLREREAFLKRAEAYLIEELGLERAMRLLQNRR